MEKRTDFYDFIDKVQRQDKYIAELEEENKKLKEELFNIKRNTKYNRLQDKLVFDDSKTAIELGARKYEADLHNRYVSELEEENKKLKEDNKRLREGVDAGQKLVEDLISKNKKLKEKLSKREQGDYRYFGNDGEQDIYEITSIKDGPITYRKDSTGKWVADGEPPYVLC